MEFFLETKTILCLEHFVITNFVYKISYQTILVVYWTLKNMKSVKIEKKKLNKLLLNEQIAECSNFKLKKWTFAE